MIKQSRLIPELISPIILIVFLCCFFCSINNTIQAQNTHFTQFDYNPLYLNAANTGSFHGDWRVAGLYRNQWRGLSDPYSTATISLDKQIYILNQKIGLGGYFINDESGSGGLMYNKLYASIAYSAIIKENFIGIGFQAGYVFSRIDSWGGWDNTTGSFTGPNGEPFSDYQSQYLDINFGLNYKRSIGIFEPEAGLALYHLNKPVISLDGVSNQKESVQYTAYALSKVNLSDKLFFVPKLLISGKDATSEAIFGSQIGYNLIGFKSTVKKVMAGVYGRTNNGGMDAFMAQAGATIGRIDLAVSYDSYLSGISQTGNLGAFEITFIYKSLSTVLNSYSIPCERY